MKTTTSLSNPWSTTALVEELDDTTLRCGHALLDSTRAEAFSRWMDLQLEELEARFWTYSTYRSVRAAIGGRR